MSLLPCSVMCGKAVYVPDTWETCLGWIAGSIFQFLKNVTGEMFVDLSVAGDRLTGRGSRILIPIVLASMANEDASVLLKLPDEVVAFHASSSSATWRTPGIFPPVRSL